MSTTSDWWVSYRSSRSRGDSAGAIRVLLEAGKGGDLRAAVTLARALWPTAPKGHCLAILEEAERRMEPTDWETHFSLYLAYSRGVGTDLNSREAISQRAFRSLVKAASLSDDAYMQFAVGLHYWQGLNHVNPNRRKAEHWLSLAASSGDPEIVREQRRFVAENRARRPKNAA